MELAFLFFARVFYSVFPEDVFAVKNDSATTSVYCLKKPIMNSTGNSPSLLAKGK